MKRFQHLFLLNREGRGSCRSVFLSRKGDTR